MKSYLFLLALVCSFFINAQVPAKEIVSEAIEVASKENKQVFVMFHASWCGWCKKMDQNMKEESVKNLFDKTYHIIHLTVLESEKNKALENPGGFEVLSNYGGAESGLPFWVVLDKSGKVITNSLDVNGNNLGCPASEIEVASFIKKLKDTTTLTTDELASIAAVFIK